MERKENVQLAQVTVKRRVYQPFINLHNRKLLFQLPPRKKKRVIGGWQCLCVSLLQILVNIHVQNERERERERD